MHARHGRSWLKVLWRAVRWEPRSHAQIWVCCAAGYLACVIVFPLIIGPLRGGAFTYVGMASGFIGAGTGMRVRLRGRRRRG